MEGDGIFLDHDERYAVTREFLAVYTALLASETVNFEGKHIRIKDGRLFFPSVHKPHPPLHFGGSSQAAAEVAAGAIDKYLTWGGPLGQVAEKIAPVAALAARQGRKITFGIRLHVIMRETSAEAWKAAADLIRHLGDDTIAAAQSIFARMDSIGQNEWRSFTAAAATSLKSARTFGRASAWCGVGPVRRSSAIRKP